MTADYNTPTKDELNFKGSFIKKSEERRASRVDEREVENRQEPVTQYTDNDLEPICVLKIELDDEIVEHIKIF
jgi:hypothetical protein